MISVWRTAMVLTVVALLTAVAFTVNEFLLAMQCSSHAFERTVCRHWRWSRSNNPDSIANSPTCIAQKVVQSWSQHAEIEFAKGNIAIGRSMVLAFGTSTGFRHWFLITVEFSRKSVKSSFVGSSYDPMTSMRDDNWFRLVSHRRLETLIDLVRCSRVLLFGEFT